MLNKTPATLYQYLLNADPKDILLFLDYDDCLEPTTVRNLSDDQINILWDLHRLTNGGVIITTNSDGRTVLEMERMSGFPIISEFATVLRNIDGFNTVTNQPIFLSDKPDAKAAFNAAVTKANELGITLVDTGEELARQVAIKLEEKEQGIAAVFGSHAQLEDAATQMVEHAFAMANISRTIHEIDYKGKDAREIKVKGATKADVIDHIHSIPALQNRSFQVAMGDSGSDWEAMKRLGRGVVVGSAISAEKMQDIHHIRIPSDNNDYSESWVFLKALRDAYIQKTCITSQKMCARMG